MEHINTHRLIQILPVPTNLALVEVYVKETYCCRHSVKLQNNSNKTITFCCELKQNFIISNIH